MSYTLIVNNTPESCNFQPGDLVFCSFNPDDSLPEAYNIAQVNHIYAQYFSTEDDSDNLPSFKYMGINITPPCTYNKHEKDRALSIVFSGRQEINITDDENTFIGGYLFLNLSVEEISNSTTYRMGERTYGTISSTNPIFKSPQYKLLVSLRPFLDPISSFKYHYCLGLITCKQNKTKTYLQDSDSVEFHDLTATFEVSVFQKNYQRRSLIEVELFL